MQRKDRIIISEQQKLEYAKMMVEEGYSNQQIQEISGACSSAVVRWKRQYKAEKQGINPQNQKALTSSNNEYKNLKNS